MAVSLIVSAGLAALLVLGLAWDFRHRSADIPAALRTVPADATGFAVIEPVDQWWASAVGHLGYRFVKVDCKTSPPDNLLANLASSVKCALLDKGIDSETPDQMRELGLDTGRPIVIAMRGRAVPGVPFVASVPVTDPQRFRATLVKLLSRLNLVEIPAHAPGDACASGDLCLTFPDPGLALVYNDRALGAAAVTDPEANLAALRADDSVAEGRRTAIAAAGGGTPWVWIHIHQFGLPLTGASTVTLQLDPDRIGLAAQTEIDTIGSALLHRLVGSAAQTGGPDMAWAATALTLRLRDDDLTAYLRFLRDNAPETARQFDEALGPYAPVTEILRGSDIVRKVEAHIARLRDGIPEATIGAAMSRDKATDAVFGFQSRRRAEHDRDMLDAVRRCRLGPPAPVPNQRPPSTPDCPLTGAEPMQSAAGVAFSPADFAGDRYCGCIGWGTEGHASVVQHGCGSGLANACPAGTVRYTYILPPVTDDDFRYGLAFGGADVDREALKADQYRPVAAYDDTTGTLWIALDLDTLLPTLDAARSHNGATAVPVLDTWAGWAKLRLNLDPRWLLAQSLLSPIREEHDFGIAFRDDLRRYRYVAVTFGASGRPNGLLVTLHLVRE